MAKTIGLVVIDVEGAYSKMIWQECARHTRRLGYDLIILPASNPEYPYHYLSQLNTLYNFINKDVMDGIIIIPSFFQNFITPKEASNLVTRIQNSVPTISLNYYSASTPSIVIDNSSGIKKLVRHLTELHNYKRIGFLCGPERNGEANARKQAYLSAMKELGLDVQDRWIFEGDFTAITARELALKRGAEIVRDLDAVICANDHSASGLMDQLGNMGYTIPKDLAVCGHDDNMEAPYMDPPLTTIRQHFDVLIQKAVELCIDLCEGRKVPPLTVFETDLTIRSSCGCNHFLCREIIAPTVAIENIELDSKTFKAVLEQHGSYKSTGRIEKPLLDLMEFLRNEPAQLNNLETFLIRLETIFDTEFHKYNSIPDWASILTAFIEILGKTGSEYISAWQEINAFEKARLLISRKQKLWNGYREMINLERYTYPIREAQQNMAMAQDEEGMIEVLKEVLPRLGIQNCFISLLYGKRKKRGLYSTIQYFSNLIFAYKGGELQEEISVSNPLRFPTLNLYPRKFKDPSSGKVWLVSTLYNRTMHYGFLISEIIDNSGSINESIRHQLSVSLHSCSLNRQREEAETKLKEILIDLEKYNKRLKQQSIIDEMTGLLNRRGFLESIHDILDNKEEKDVSFTLFFADMDGLKKINDSQGHNEGDRAIIDMSEILQEVFRQEDIIARLGGDEFTIFTMDTPPGFAKDIKIRLDESLSLFRKTIQRPYKLSMSIGSVQARTDDENLDILHLLDIADEQLYAEKRKRKRER